MTDSVRKDILEAIKAAFSAVQPPDTADPDYVPSEADWPFAFSSVDLGPVPLEDHRKRSAVGIVAGGERERFTYPYREHNWEVAIEFRVTVNKGDQVPALMAEDYLTVVKRVIDQNGNWGGLAVDTKRTRNEVDITTYADKSVFGVQFIEIMYRTDQHDPRRRFPPDLAP